MMKKNSTRAWWSLSDTEVSQYFKTDSKRGLTDTQVSQQLEEYGLNQLPEQKKASVFLLFLHQFAHVIVWILIGALVVSGLLGDWVDVIAIGTIIVLNAVIGFFQEYHAEKALDALKKLIKSTSRVIRDGTLQTIESAKVVPGDLVLLEAGDLVPADGRIIYMTQLATQEASLTGESEPIAKQTTTLSEKELAIGDRNNMVFMGTIVVRGKGTIIVTETGTNTELGKIASLLTTEYEPTPLQRQLKRVGHQLILFCCSIIALVFLLGILRNHSYMSMILTALSLAVAAIPEGLPTVITVALAIGVRKMAKRKAIIRRLMSVETLGCTSVICTDKTGTLTKNEMTVQKIWVNNTYIDVTGNGYEPVGEFVINQISINPEKNPELSLALKIGVLCNDAALAKKNNHWGIIGDPTEGALLVAAEKAGFKKNVLHADSPLLNEIPFDSERKRMSVLRKTQTGSVLYVKGAADVMCKLSTHLFLNNQEVVLTEQHKQNILQAHDDLARQALRVLAVAYRNAPESESVHEGSEKDLVFVGLFAMIDPPRPEAKEAIEKCTRAGIRTVMITGDHKETAIAIGKALGLTENDTAVTGTELNHMSDETLKTIVQDTSIFARTSAEHKIRIVQAWQKLGHIVAVTGDGVNDAPAIKKANIGIAMGITGTDVTKEASDIVITDDNFASIVNAVEEGRGIYDNIVKFINYLLSANVAELLIIFISTLFAFQDPSGNPYIALLPIQLLWLNLVTDGLPAIALAMDPINPNVMSQPPRNPSEKILSFFFMLQILVIGFILTVGVFIACYFGLRTSAALGHTMTLTSFVVLELVRIHMIRARYHIGFLSNPWMIVALTVSLFLQIMIVYTPFFQKIFSMTPLGITEWLVIVSIAAAMWIVGTITESILLQWKNNQNNGAKLL